MASSIFTTLFMSTILFSIASAKATPFTVGKFCSGTSDPKFCVQFLQAIPQVTSSKNLNDAAINILKSGTSSVTTLLNYAKLSINKPGIDPNVKNALVECTKAYDTVIASYNSALKEVETDSTFEGTATYDLQVGCYDYMQPCLDAVAAAKIVDPLIVNGNNAAQKIGSYAASVITKM